MDLERHLKNCAIKGGNVKQYIRKLSAIYRSYIMHNTPYIKPTSGFTLIEISIVLIIIGLILGLGMGLVGPTLKGAKIKQAEGMIDSAIESVVSFGMTNKRLPNLGSEFTPLLRNPNDPWGNQLQYIYDNDTATSGSGGICGRKTTSITLQIHDNITGVRTITDVALIVFSGGANFNIQTGTSSPTAWGSQDIRSAKTVDIYSPLDNPNTTVTGLTGSTDPYEDIVKWVTLSELRTKIGCQGSQLKILNNDLPSASLLSPYNSSIYADGGTGSSTYTWYGVYNPSTTPTVPGSSGITWTTIGGVGTVVGTTSVSANLSWATTSTWTTTAGTHQFIFAVKDSNNNYDNKSFVITVNP